MTAVLFLVLACCASTWIFLFRVAPAAARARFQQTTSGLRDECEDLQLAGALPMSSPCVDEFVNRADVLSRYAGGFTVINTLCAHLAAMDAGMELPERPPMHDLSVEQRHLVEQFDERLQVAVKRYLLSGSATGWVFFAAVKAAAMVRAVKKVRMKAPSVERLTYEFEEVAFNWDAAESRVAAAVA